MKSNKYSKLPNKPASRLAPGNPPLVVYLPRDDGRLKKFDFNFFLEGKCPRPQIAKACADVFRIHYSDYSSPMRSATYQHLRQFSRFLAWREGGSDSEQVKVVSTLQFTDALFTEYQVYLSIVNRENKEATSATKYHRVARFFAVMQMRRPEYLPPDFKIPSNIFSHGDGHNSTIDGVLSASEIKLIVSAAEKEVDRIRENHRRALELLEAAAANDAQARMSPKPPGFWSSIGNVLYYLVRVGGMTSVSGGFRSALWRYNYPTPMEMVGWYAPTSDDYFVPFLVLIYLRTAINVTSIHTLKRDCLEEHPLPLGLTNIHFKKPRAKSQADKKLSFPTRQRNGAIELIRFLLEYTQPWVEYVGEAEKNSLFLYYSRTSGVRSAGHEFADHSLARFIARNNLPHFSFDQLRPTVATMIYLHTRDIFRVQRLLNHSSARTTVKYIRGALVHAQHDKDMAKGIDAMVEAVTGMKYHGKGVSVFDGPVEKVVAAKVEEKEITAEAGKKILKGGCMTLIGKCKDPTNSPQPGEVKGKVCTSLHACVFCDNCWIFLEDLPEVIKYRNALEAEKADMTADVWEMLHGDAVREINESVLSAFPAEVVAQAELEAR